MPLERPCCPLAGSRRPLRASPPCARQVQGAQWTLTLQPTAESATGGRQTWLLRHGAVKPVHTGKRMIQTMPLRPRARFYRTIDLYVKAGLRLRFLYAWCGNQVDSPSPKRSTAARRNRTKNAESPTSSPLKQPRNPTSYQGYSSSYQPPSRQDILGKPIEIIPGK